MKRVPQLGMAAAFTALSVVVVAACGENRGDAGASGSGAVTPIPIGLVAEASGSLASFGDTAIKIMNQGAKDIGTFKVDGQRYRFQVRGFDNQSQAAQSVSITQKLLSSDVKYIFGTVASTDTMPMIAVAHTKAMEFVQASQPYELLGKPGYPWLFRIVPTEATATGQVATALPIALKALNVSKIGVLLPNDDVSNFLIEALRSALGSTSAKVVGIQRYAQSTSDFTSALLKLKSAGAQALFFGYTNETAVPILRQATQSQSFLKFFAMSGPDNTPAEPYKDLPGFVYTWALYVPQPTTESHIPAVAKWTKRLFGSGTVPPSATWALAYYNTMFALRDAMQAAGTVTDLNKVAAAIHGHSFDAPLGKMIFDAKGQVSSCFDVGVLSKGALDYTEACPS